MNIYWHWITNGFAFIHFLIVFTIVGPFIVQSVMHYSPIVFGYTALLLGLCWFIGATINRFLIHINLQLKTKICLGVMFLVSIINLILTFYIDMSIYSLIVPIVLMTVFGGVIFPNNFTCAVSLFPTMTGSANALFGGFIFILTSTTSGLATYLKSTNLTPLAAAYVGLILVCIIMAGLRKYDGF